MPLKLGIDFGTATICAATVRDPVRMIPEFVQVDGRDLADSAVWFEWASHRPRVVQSGSSHPRHPTAVFHGAATDFAAYWKQRVVAQGEYASWEKWLKTDREGSMLLSYFKPEL